MIGDYLDYGHNLLGLIFEKIGKGLADTPN